ARSHHEAIDGGEPHGRGDAAAVLNRAEASAVPQVGEDDAPASELRRELLQARDEKLVGESMKPVSPDALFGEAAREGERLGKIRLGAMERRVEAGDLRKLRRDIHDRAHGRDIVWLM